MEKDEKQSTAVKPEHEPSAENFESTIPIDLVLEAPPEVDSPVEAFDPSSSLFSPDDESLAILNAKFAITESFMKLLTRDLKFNDFTRELLLTAMKVVKSEAGSLFEVDYNNQSIFFRAVAGQSSDVVQKFTIPMGQGIVGHVADSRLPMVVSNLGDNAMHMKSISDAVGFEARNLIALPISVRGKTYGVLELLNRVGENTFSPTDLDVLNYFCDMAARALEIRFMIAWANQKATQAAGSQEAA